MALDADGKLIEEYTSGDRPYIGVDKEHNARRVKIYDSNGNVLNDDNPMPAKLMGSFVLLHQESNITVLAGAAYKSSADINLTDFNKVTVKTAEVNANGHSHDVGVRYEFPDGLYAGIDVTQGTNYLNEKVESPLQTDKGEIYILNRDTVDRSYNAYMWGVKV